MSSLKYRTHTCGELSTSEEGSSVVLSGWVDARRDHGGLVFLDLRDRYGLTQVVVDPAEAGKYMKLASELRNEYVLRIKGVVRLRPKEMVNQKLATGTIEVLASELQLLSRAKVPPFVLKEEVDASESLRLQYRYLDLRCPKLQRNLQVRHQFFQFVRDYLVKRNFLEIETPILFKSTPEGARDYLVPSRNSPGMFYALPQSPQTLKQLLMIGGLDRYFQFAHCFRDEDLRADRQPEFSQLDIEMSFVTEREIYELVEGLVQFLYKGILGRDISFSPMTYAQAMETYGVDKPDTRFGLTIKDASAVFKETKFQAFSKVLGAGGAIKGLCVEGGGDLSRKKLEDLTDVVAPFGAKGLGWFKVGESLTSPIVKFLSSEEQSALKECMGAVSGDLILLVADQDFHVLHSSLGHLRLHLGRECKLIDESTFSFHWITEFPLLEYDREAGRYVPKHHPFTQPHPEDMEDFCRGERLSELRACAYDLVCNGHEIAGGSLRIHDSNVQKGMFSALQLSEEEVKEKFGFFVEALQYGTPPHGGIAFGVDRNIMLLTGMDAIRDVIAFPKTQKANCLMSACPDRVAAEQLRDLQLQFTKRK